MYKLGNDILILVTLSFTTMYLHHSLWGNSFIHIFLVVISTGHSKHPPPQKKVHEDWEVRVKVILEKNSYPELIFVWLIFYFAHLVDLLNDRWKILVTLFILSFFWLFAIQSLSQYFKIVILEVNLNGFFLVGCISVITEVKLYNILANA